MHQKKFKIKKFRIKFKWLLDRYLKKIADKLSDSIFEILNIPLFIILLLFKLCLRTVVFFLVLGLGLCFKYNGRF